jgi:hypothetical protein
MRRSIIRRSRSISSSSQSRSRILDVILALGRALPGQLGVFAVEGRQAELLEMVLEQHLRGLAHARAPDIRLM